MSHVNVILGLFDRECWTRVGFAWEKSTIWKAMYWGLQVLEANEADVQALKDNVNGTGTDVSEKVDSEEHYETEENVSPYSRISNEEKFHWACYILCWMDDQEEFHTYIRDSKECYRHRPDVSDEVEKFLKQPLSEAKRRMMDDALGEKYAANWAVKAEEESNAKFERYGEDLIALINDERERLDAYLSYNEDWDWTAFAVDVSRSLAKPLQQQIETLPEKYSYTAPWVIQQVASLTMIQKACAEI